MTGAVVLHRTQGNFGVFFMRFDVLRDVVTTDRRGNFRHIQRFKHGRFVLPSSITGCLIRSAEKTSLTLKPELWE